MAQIAEERRKAFRRPIVALLRHESELAAVGLAAVLFVAFALGSWFLGSDSFADTAVLALSLVSATAISVYLAARRREADRKRQISISSSLRGVDLSLINFRRAYLRGKDLRSAKLSDSDFSKADLSFATLHDARVVGTRLNEAKLDGASARRASFYRASLVRASLDGFNARSASFDRADLRESKLCRADLRQSTFVGADLSDADLSEADLRGVDFTGAELQGANFRGAKVDETFEASADLADRTKLPGGAFATLDQSAAYCPPPVLPEDPVLGDQIRARSSSLLLVAAVLVGLALTVQFAETVRQNPVADVLGDTQTATVEVFVSSPQGSSSVTYQGPKGAERFSLSGDFVDELVNPSVGEYEVVVSPTDGSHASCAVHRNGQLISSALGSGPQGATCRFVVD